MNVYHLNINISEQEWLRFYTGQATTVLCTSVEGVKISLPAYRFRAFTTKNGVQGRFRLTLQQNKFISLEKIA